MEETMHIGIDDTDSTRMGCTTYVAALLVERLTKLGLKFVDYPSLIRLNPNVPWKTRGNGAVCLRLRGDKTMCEEAKRIVIDTVEEESDLQFKGTEPGIVFYYGEKIPAEFTKFAKKAIQDIVSIKETLKLVKRFRSEAIGFKRGRGVIGALAAIGETLTGDKTYEIIVYRVKKNCGTLRKVDKNSILLMNEKTNGLTFCNYDLEKRRILITPRGKDPVLYGVRGENPQIVKEAHKMIKVYEEVERWIIFKTNQGTDAHLRRVKNISEIKPHRPIIVKGYVSKEPIMITGRHVIFSMKDKSGEIDCAAYEPTGKFRGIIKKLIYGDLIEAYGGVRPRSIKHPMTINLEKIRILDLSKKIIYRNPVCNHCGKHMKSMGSGKGFECKKCKTKITDPKKVPAEAPRDLKAGLHIPPPRAHRHLTKPLCRYEKENDNTISPLIEEWHKP
jgi:tRNA(Ile2)-agmatinylcytidine synthase